MVRSIPPWWGLPENPAQDHEQTRKKPLGENLAVQLVDFYYPQLKTRLSRDRVAATEALKRIVTESYSDAAPRLAALVAADRDQEAIHRVKHIIFPFANRERMKIAILNQWKKIARFYTGSEQTEILTRIKLYQDPKIQMGDSLGEVVPGPVGDALGTLLSPGE